MAKHEIEMPDEAIPDGWKLTGEYRQVNCYDDYMPLPGNVAEWLGDEPSDEAYLILRKVEPVRESQWMNIYPKGSNCGNCFHASREYAITSRAHQFALLVRIDYENGVPVSAHIEPVT
jgi:hypothetical protein